MCNGYNIKNYFKPIIFIYYSKENIMTIFTPNKKHSFALLTMLATSTVIATTPFAASASCNNPLSSVVNTGCDIADVDFEIENDGGVALTSEDSAVLTDGDYSSVLTNNGAISFANSDTGEDVDIYGINISGNLTGSVINNGSITFTSLTTDDIDSYGIIVNGENNGEITNNGTITISGISTNDTVTNYGIYVGGDSNGTITNNGTIDITSISSSSNLSVA
jgi:hypothetical protein